MVNDGFMRGLDQRKYGELIHNLSIHNAIKNNKYPKTLQEAVNGMCKVNLKQKIIMLKVTHKIKIEWR